jgi:hypothetical protein
MPPVDQSAPPLPGAPPRRPPDLPHGLLAPPDRALELVAREKAKFPAHIFTPQAEERLLNDWTVQYHFDGLGYDVVYRSSPRGPEVLAVGAQEIHALRDAMSEGEWRTLKTWLFG